MRPIGLRLPPQLSAIIGRRITYAFRTFCAVYGYEPAPEMGDGAFPVLCYGTHPVNSWDVFVAAVYDGRDAKTPAPAPQIVPLSHRRLYASLRLENVPCFAANNSGDVDWLGEIFEWLSCADEFAVTERDDVGRIPFAAALHGRFNLDPTIPYAAVAMYELNCRIAATMLEQWPERAIKPWDGAHQSLVAASHDLDYLPLGAFDQFRRLIKNLGVAAVAHRDPGLVLDIVGAAVRGVLSWKSPLDCMDEMTEREKKAGTSSTSNVICSQAHPRDANYALDDARVRLALEKLATNGMEVAVHGSYTSLEGAQLASEIVSLSAIGYDVSGVRQHWLRYAGDNLFEAVENAGMIYDSTVGFSERVGFRSGACFPYLPYNFRKEQAYSFLEIPLVIMDGALYEHARKTHLDAARLCARVTDMTEAFGWGGVSVLWHNTVFRGAQLPYDIGKLYWTLPRSTQEYTTLRRVAEISSPRFLDAWKAEASRC